MAPARCPGFGPVRRLLTFVNRGLPRAADRSFGPRSIEYA